MWLNTSEEYMAGRSAPSAIMLEGEIDERIEGVDERRLGNNSECRVLED